MRGDELLDILEHIDPALIENADRKPKSNWLRWTALAAGLALIIGLCTYPFHPPVDPEPPVITTAPVEDPSKLPLSDFTLSPAQLSGMQNCGTATNYISIGGQSEMRDFGFDIAIVVEARVAQILPDVYLDPTYNSTYHILRMETLDVINGKNVPDTFFLKLPTAFSPELDRFDSLILSIRQTGIENYMMVNQTSHAVTPFSLMFEIYNLHRYWSVPVVAFTDGVMDPSLWELENWDIGKWVIKRIMTNTLDYTFFPATKGSTPADAKARILDEIAKYEPLRDITVRTTADFPTDPMFDFVVPYRNGVFSHSLYMGALYYNRLINGFKTTERIEMRNGIATYEGEPFTQEDLAAMPDIGILVEQLNADPPSPPHMEIDEDQNIRLTHWGITGKYAKVNGKVYGIVKVSWQYLQQETMGPSYSYYDALYYLVSTDGSYRNVDAEDLQTILWEDPLINDPEYGVPIENPMV